MRYYAVEHEYEFRSIRPMPEDDFLAVSPGDLVVVEAERIFNKTLSASDWWLGRVVHVVTGPRESTVNSLFQIADVDTGVIRSVNADLVKGKLKPN